MKDLTPYISQTPDALVQFAKWGKIDKVKELIESGTDINLRNNYDETALMVACFEGHEDIIKYLITHNADINGSSPYGKSPALFVALWNEKWEAAKFLIDLGADTSLKNEIGETAESIAREKGNEDMVQIIENAKSNYK